MNAIFLTARLKSTRLKRKVLLELYGIPLILYIVNRIRANTDTRIILCTSTNSQDDELCDFAFENSLDCFRGAEEDVLDRYYHAALKFNIDKFYIVYADEPFIDINLMQDTLNIMNQSEPEFVDNSNFIDGTFGYGMTFHAIKYIAKVKTLNNLEVWGPYVRSLPGINVLTFNHDHKITNVRLTVDYEEDWTMFKEMINILGGDYKYCALSEIIKAYLKQNFYEINGHRINDYNFRIKDQSAY